MADIIQKATEWDKQSAGFKKARVDLESLRSTHIMQPKYDGCHMLVDTTARRAFSRTNETVRSCDHIIKRCADLFGPDWVVQGEAYMQDTPFPFISGKYRQHAPWEPMEFVVYDALPRWAFNTRGFDEPYQARLGTLEERLVGTYAGEGQTWLTSTLWPRLPSIAEAAAVYVSGLGYDGLILRDPLAPWVAGPSKRGELIKVKPSVSLDLRVVAWASQPGAKTGRKVVTFTVEYRGTRTDVGSGVPHDITPDNANSYVGQIVEVECMAVNPNNTLREPRFKGVRWDKEEPDT